MKRYIERLTFRMNELTAQLHPVSNTMDSQDTASVLMEDDIDTSLLVKPERTLKVELDILGNVEVKKELEQKLHSLQKAKDSELWMYFDSGASRSFISSLRCSISIVLIKA
jgi:hypothetical protein